PPVPIEVDPAHVMMETIDHVVVEPVLEHRGRSVGDDLRVDAEMAVIPGAPPYQTDYAVILPPREPDSPPEEKSPPPQGIRIMTRRCPQQLLDFRLHRRWAPFISVQHEDPVGRGEVDGPVPLGTVPIVGTLVES